MYPIHHSSATGVGVKRKNEKCKKYVHRLAGGAHHCRKPGFSGAVVAKATDQAKTDSSTTKNSEKKNAGVAPAQKKNSSKKPTASRASTSPAAAPKDAPGSSAPASDPPMAGQKASSVSTSTMVWVNKESGVFHKPGTRRYGKTKTGKIHDGSRCHQGWLPSGKERMSPAFPLRKKRGTLKHCQRSFAMVARAQRECFSNAHFSRKMTSPWPTSWSFNHKRYL